MRFFISNLALDRYLDVTISVVCSLAIAISIAAVVVNLVWNT